MASKGPAANSGLLNCYLRTSSYVKQEQMMGYYLGGDGKLTHVHPKFVGPPKVCPQKPQT